VLLELLDPPGRIHALGNDAYRAGSGRGAPLRRNTIANMGKATPEAARRPAMAILGAVASGQDSELPSLRLQPVDDALGDDQCAATLELGGDSLCLRMRVSHQHSRVSVAADGGDFPACSDLSRRTC
jgi:hypothetical protein